MKITVRENHMEEIEEIRPEFPYTCHHVEMKNTRVPWHWHEELEFDRILTGEVQLKTAGRSMSFRAGEAYFTNANVLSSLEGSRETVLKSHIFHPVFLTGHYHSVFETNYLDPVLHNRKIEIIAIRGESRPQKDILNLLKKAEALWGQTGQEMWLRNIFSEIWMALMEEIRSLKEEERAVPSRDQERLFTMISYIQEHAAEKVTLEQIAAAAAVGTRECLRCFRKGINETPFAYLMEYRVEMAQRLLRQTDVSVLDIANETGFSSSAYFAKIFKRTTGMTPVQYRKRMHLEATHE